MQFCSQIVRKTKKKELHFWCNSLIFSVDQPGLEPGTSRLWVCCSNQLSYKSDATFTDGTNHKRMSCQFCECKVINNILIVQVFLFFSLIFMYRRNLYIRLAFSGYQTNVCIAPDNICWLRQVENDVSQKQRQLLPTPRRLLLPKLIRERSQVALHIAVKVWGARELEHLWDIIRCHIALM